MAEEEHITVKLPQLPPYEGKVLSNDKVYVWEESTETLKFALVEQLPFGSGGGGGGPHLGSPFKKRLGDEGVTIIELPSGAGFNTKISDSRLLGKTDYPVNSSQINNGAFRDDELVYNAVDGTVTILGISLMQGEIVVLYPDGITTGGGAGGNLQPIIEQLAEIKLMLAPFIPTVTGANAGRVLWMRPANEIPIGWTEDEVMRGFFPLGCDPRVEAFKTVGDTGGAFKKKILIENMPSHGHDTLIGQTQGDGTSPGLVYGNPQFDRRYSSERIGGDKDLDITNPYRIVHWIKFTGIA